MQRALGQYAQHHCMYFYLAKCAPPHLDSGGNVIDCAWINAYTHRPDLLDYTDARGLVIAFTQGLHKWQISAGIRVKHV